MRTLHILLNFSLSLKILKNWSLLSSTAWHCVEGWTLVSPCDPPENTDTSEHVYGSAGQAAKCGSGPPSHGRVDEQTGVCPCSGRVEPGRSRTPAIIRGQQQAERHVPASGAKAPGCQDQIAGGRTKKQRAAGV